MKLKNSETATSSSLTVHHRFMDNRAYSVKGKLVMFETVFAPWAYIPIPQDKIPNVRTGGWGSIPVIATIGKTSWRTSLFPLKKDSYFLPVKKDVRKKESLSIGDNIKVKYRIVE